MSVRVTFRNLKLDPRARGRKDLQCGIHTYDIQGRTWQIIARHVSCMTKNHAQKKRQIIPLPYHIMMYETGMRSGYCIITSALYGSASLQNGSASQCDFSCALCACVKGSRSRHRPPAPAHFDDFESRTGGGFEILGIISGFSSFAVLCPISANNEYHT